MIENETLLDQLSKLLKWKKSKKFYADKLNISEEQVDELLQELNPKEQDKDIFPKTFKASVEKGTVESTMVLSFEPKNDSELAKLHKIDLNKYIITNYWTKLLPNGKFTSSVFAKLKTSKDYSASDFAEFLNTYTPPSIPFSKLSIDSTKSLVNVEISISDFHLAKKVIEEPNHIVARKLAYLSILKDLVEKVKANYNIYTIVFPISNDFFHSDNYYNQTTNGTPQDVIVDYAQEYEHGFDLLVQAISFLKENCSNVEVLLVQGNHDKTKSFYLAHALEVFFSRESDIFFDRRDGHLKASMLGNTFIGYHHGNCKIEDLPLLFATHPEYSESFGKAKYREIHTGDKHHYMAKEVKGVKIQQMPSLSGTDRWHRDNNYVHSVRAALALVYDFSTGKTAEFESRL